jgi:hypothetical protein
MTKGVCPTGTPDSRAKPPANLIFVCLPVAVRQGPVPNGVPRACTLSLRTECVFLTADVRLQFVRTVSTSKSLAPAVVALVQSFKWMRCLIVCHDEDTFGVTAAEWSDSLAAAGIYVKILRTDGSEARRSAIDGFDPMPVMSTILESRQRVIIVLAPTDMVGSIALAADAKGMVSAGWAWISDALCSRVDFRGHTTQACLHSSIAVATLGSACAMSFPMAFLLCLQANDMRKALHGWLYIAAVVPDNPRVREFAQDVRVKSERELMIKIDEAGIDSAATHLYDAIYLWAHAYTHVLSQQGSPR